MDTTIRFDDVYKTSMRCLRNIGAHPFQPKDRKWALRFFFLYGLFCTIGVHYLYNMIFVNIKQNDFPNMCSNGIFFVIVIVVSFKYGVNLWYQKELQELINLQETYFQLSQEFTAAEQATVQKYIEKGNWISKLWLKSCFITCILFPIKSFIDSAYSAYIGDFKLYSFTENSYPLGLDKIKDRLDIYLLIYGSFMYFAFFSGSMYTGFAPLGPIFIMNACGQVDIVTKRINRLFDGKEFNKEETPKELKSIIQFLQHIYR